MKKIRAIVILGGAMVKEGNKWRTTNFNEGDNFGIQGDRLRVEAGRYLFKDNKKSSDFLIVVSGGKGQLEAIPDAPTLAELLSQELMELGVDPKIILAEKQSANTYQQLKELAGLVSQNRFLKLEIISNEYHLPRIEAMIECAPGLENLKLMFSAGDLILESAEKIVLNHERPKWESIIKNAYQSEAMQARIHLEEQGVNQIRSGSYRFK